MNGMGFRPFDMVIPFAVRKGEITGTWSVRKPFREVLLLVSMIIHLQLTIWVV